MIRVRTRTVATATGTCLQPRTFAGLEEKAGRVLSCPTGVGRVSSGLRLVRQGDLCFISHSGFGYLTGNLATTGLLAR